MTKATKLEKALLAALLAACVGVVVIAGASVARVARAGEVSIGPIALDGTFTPTIVGVTSAGTASYTVQIGRHTRTGNRVHVNIALTYTAGTGTGQGAVAGLPYAARGVTSADHVCSVLSSSYTFGAGQVSAGISQGESQIRLWLLTSGGAIGAVAYDAAASVWLSCTYEAAPL